MSRSTTPAAISGPCYQGHGVLTNKLKLVPQLGVTLPAAPPSDLLALRGEPAGSRPSTLPRLESRSRQDKSAHRLGRPQTASCALRGRPLQIRRYPRRLPRPLAQALGRRTSRLPAARSRLAPSSARFRES